MIIKLSNSLRVAHIPQAKKLGMFFQTTWQIMKTRIVKFLNVVNPVLAHVTNHND